MDVFLYIDISIFLFVRSVVVAVVVAVVVDVVVDDDDFVLVNFSKDRTFAPLSKSDKEDGLYGK